MIQYTSHNDPLTEGEYLTLCDLITRLTRATNGAFRGDVFFQDEKTGEKMTIHLECHDSVLCEMALLEQIDGISWGTKQ